MNFFTVSFDIFNTRLDSSSVHVDYGIRLHGILKFIERLSPRLHSVADLRNIVLHLMDEAVDRGDNLHALSNIFINGTTTIVAGTPHDFINTRL